MKDLNKNIEEFAEALGAFEATPSDMVWNQLETKLDSPNGPHSNRSGLFSGGIFTVALFCLLLVMEGSIFYLSTEQILKDNLLELIDLEAEESKIEVSDNQVIELGKEKSISQKSSEIVIAKPQTIPFKTTKENVEIQLIEVKEANIQSADFSPAPIVENVAKEKEVLKEEVVKEEETLEEETNITENKPKAKLTNPAVEAYKKRLRANSSKKKKKFRMGLQLPSLRHKPWRRGKSWDYQVGIMGGTQIKRIVEQNHPGLKLGINGEIAFSPYLRLATGVHYTNQRHYAQALAYYGRWDPGQFPVFPRNFTIVDSMYTEARIHYSSLNIPLEVKFFLPLSKQKFEPYIGAGIIFQMVTLSNVVSSFHNRAYIFEKRVSNTIEPQVSWVLRAGAEFKLNKRMNLQVGAGYQQNHRFMRTFHLETSLWFTGNRGYFKWRKEY